MPRFIIISTGIADRELCLRCMASVNPSYCWHHLELDANEDSNMNPQGYAGIGFYSIVHLDRRGALKNFVNAMEYLKPSSDDVIVRLDADDQLTLGAIQVVAKAYQDNPEALMTYGSATYESGREARFQGAYKDNNFRQASWRCPHLLTFRAGLWSHIKKNAFLGKDKQYFQSAADLAIFYPLAELAGLDRMVHIETPLYIYNDLNDLNDHKIDPELQKRCEKLIRRKPQHKRVKHVN